MDDELLRQGLYIQLQNYSRPYHPGETIIGQLYVVFRTSQEFKCEYRPLHKDLIIFYVNININA
jgi:hypothetical protein